MFKSIICNIPYKDTFLVYICLNKHNTGILYLFIRISRMFNSAERTDTDTSYLHFCSDEMTSLIVCGICRLLLSHMQAFLHLRLKGHNLD